MAESPSDVRRKRAALLLVFTVFAIAIAIDRLPVPAPQPITPARPASYAAGVTEPLAPVNIPSSALVARSNTERSVGAVVASPRVRTHNAAMPVAPPPVPSTIVAESAPLIDSPPTAAEDSSSVLPLLPSRQLRFDAEVPILATARPHASPYGDGNGIGAAGQAVGRAFGIAGRQIVGAFRRTGDAVKGAF